MVELPKPTSIWQKRDDPMTGLPRRGRLFVAGAACLAVAVASLGCSSDGESDAEAGSRRKASSRLCDGGWRGPTEPGVAAAARLVLNRPLAHPGATLQAMIENLGTEKLLFGIRPRIYRAVGGRWAEQDGSGYVLRAEYLAPRSSSPCLPVPIGEKWRPGRYRVSFEVSAVRSREDLRDRRLWAFFRVKPAS
jgi:hypothetical protein